MKLIYCFALTITVVGCSPLRNVQTEKHTSVDIADTTLTKLVRQEIERNIGQLNQTVVEYYPPTEIPTTTDTLPAMVAKPQKIPQPRQPVKRIIKTEYTTQRDRQTTTDSLSHSRINTAARNDEQTTVDEKPNTTVSTSLKWSAACLLLVLLILIIIKLR